VTAAWKELSHVNAKGMGTNGWVIGSLDWLKKKRRGIRRSEISGRDLQKPFGEFKTINSLHDDKC
jgi:hypothetical protein